MTTFIQAKFEFSTGKPAPTWLVVPDNDPFTLAEVLAIYFPGDAYGIVCLFEDLSMHKAARQNSYAQLSPAGSGFRWLGLGEQTFAQYLDRFVSRDPELRDILRATFLPLGRGQLPVSSLASLSGGKL